MATASFIVFIVVGVLLSRMINPKNEFIALGIGLFIPLAMLGFTILVFGKGDGFLSGQVAAQCLISTVVTIIVMIILLLRKLDKSNSSGDEKKQA
ncbi:MAG: hypothetical protein A2W91_08875 [Bacteroidetes bacterium GWF2_38_335]|nr:MAG: hypothetical protein A2W91_08875 [Bacteroidetes bacterium GWF2_38_335]OFY80485.1 MAG: hypothetical protein A2281_08600 [Bacteroidetes bacterium RIFOXYA12_FULL_38_20]HBS85906.1 hypothetical protein [Bacteroidales bacterium]